MIIPELNDPVTLSYFHAMLVQSAFFVAYFFMSLPDAAILGSLAYPGPRGFFDATNAV